MLQEGILSPSAAASTGVLAPVCCVSPDECLPDSFAIPSVCACVGTGVAAPALWDCALKTPGHVPHKLWVTPP
eukprot:scaffold271219_cov22-Tisochrysis_lutea.AAC.1